MHFIMDALFNELDIQQNTYNQMCSQHPRAMSLENSVLGVGEIKYRLARLIQLQYHY